MREMSRRDALKIGAGTALMLGAPPVLAACGGSSSGTTAASGGSPTVVHAILGDSLSELYGMAGQAMQALGITRNSLVGARVFIKPNFVGFGIFPVFYPESGENAKPEIVAAVAEQCLLAGAARVTIGDGAQGLRWPWENAVFLPGNTVFGASNLATAVAYLNAQYDDRVELLCLNEANQWSPIPSSCQDRRIAGELFVAQRFYEADHVISVPVLKSHQWAGLTAALKCFVGLAPLKKYQLMGEPSRGALHKAYAHTTCGGVEDVGIEGAFIDMFKWRREEGKEDFAVIDCSIGLEKDGPHNWGDRIPFPLPGSDGQTVDFKQRSTIGKYFLLASSDLVAADSVAARITLHDVDTLKQLVMARNLGLGETQNILVKGASVADLTVLDWIKATHLEEWGVAPSAQAAVRGPVSSGGTHSFNHLFSWACPTAMACAFKWLHRRKMLLGGGRWTQKPQGTP